MTLDGLPPECMVPIKLAIVGCGAITDQGHLPAALRAPLIEVTALVDNDLARAELLRRKYACSAEVCDDVARVLPKVDGVLVATPNHAHGDVARLVLENGLPVLIEKPMTTSYAEAQALCELARRRSTFISVGFVTRQYPVTRLFKRLLDERVFGRVGRFHVEFGTAGGWAPVSNYNLDRKLSGGGVLVINGTHAIDRLLYWFGEPKSFTYADDSYGGVEANCKAELDYGDGLRGSFFFSKTIALKNRFVFESDQAIVELAANETRQLTVTRRDLPGVRLRIDSLGSSGTDDYFQEQLNEFARVLRDGGAPTVDGEAGAASVRWCERFYSARTQLDEPWAWYRRLDKERRP